MKRKFYAACNAVLADCRYADEFVKLHLVKSYCLPLLTYCIGLLDLPSCTVKDLGVCWNDTFVRKIFGYNRWESVTELQYIVMRCLLNIFTIYANGTFCIALRMSVYIFIMKIVHKVHTHN